MDGLTCLKIGSRIWIIAGKVIYIRVLKTGFNFLMHQHLDFAQCK
jgi:hypothetical protein